MAAVPGNPTFPISLHFAPLRQAFLPPIFIFLAAALLMLIFDRIVFRERK